MEFEWDAEKRKINLAKHDIDFTRAARILEGPHVTYPSSRAEEDR